jgi:hypothetical protein
MTRARLRQRISALGTKLAASAPAPPVSQSEPADELPILAGELAAEFGRTVAVYRKFLKIDETEARARAIDIPDALYERALTGNPENLSWHELEAISQRDPDRALQRWEEVKEAARKEVSTGYRAARALEGAETNCWRRARFLAVRSLLVEGLRPRGPAEQMLLDQMAQHQTLLWQWQAILSAYTGLACERPRETDGPWEPPRVSEAEAIEEAMSMIERFQRLYLSCLRELQKMRRAPITVTKVRQLNIANQQVNVAE